MAGDLFFISVVFTPLRGAIARGSVILLFVNNYFFTGLSALLPQGQGALGAHFYEVIISLFASKMLRISPRSPPNSSL